MKKALRQPMFLKGRKGVNLSYSFAAMMSHNKKKVDPTIKVIPPRLGLKSEAIEGK